MKIEDKKLIDADKFYRTLSLICFPLSILLILRRLFLLQHDMISLIFGFFWPLVGIIISVLFLKRDGYTISASEIMFYFFILYCSIYFIFTTVSLLISPELSQNLFILPLNFLILGFGWLGIAYYIIY